MSDHERQPLLHLPAGKRGDCHQITLSKIASISLLTIIIVVALGSIPLVEVTMDFFTYTDPACPPGTTYSIDVESRSGSFSLLTNITNLTCIEPQVGVSLTSKDSLVEIHQAICKEVEIMPFQVQVDFNQSFSIANEPMPAFDENYSSQNYFINGTMKVEIINATTNISSVTIEICLFISADDYNDFLEARENWKNYTQTGDCNSTIVSLGENIYMMNSFNLTEPSFAFLGVASTGPLVIDQLKINATGSNISTVVGNSEVCQLSDKQATCTVHFSVQNESVCMVAYEEGNPDGSYDYSNLTLNFVQLKHNPFETELIAYGFSSLSILTVLLFALTLTSIVWCKQCYNSMETDKQATNSERITPTSEDNGRSSRQPITCTVSTNG